jgi:thiol-disulfide isomerase/thioredoxin
MKKNIISTTTTKYLLLVLLVILIFGILYYFMSNNKTDISMDDMQMSIEQEMSISGRGVLNDSIIEGFSSSNMGYNQSKMIIIYTASWCPHCRSFMGMQDKESPIGEDSEFTKTKNELGDCFEHVMDTDPNSSERMQKHGISGYPGIAFVDKNSDVGIPLGNTKRTAEDICSKFKALSS